MRSSPVVRASDCQCTSCNGPGFDPSIRRHSGIWGAADEAVLNIVRTKKFFIWCWETIIRDHEGTFLPYHSKKIKNLKILFFQKKNRMNVEVIPFKNFGMFNYLGEETEWELGVCSQPYEHLGHHHPLTGHTFLSCFNCAKFKRVRYSNKRFLFFKYFILKLLGVIDLSWTFLLLDYCDKFVVLNELKK